MQKVKLTAQQYYHDKYHGPVHTGTQAAILHRSQSWNPLAKWLIESSDFLNGDVGEYWDTKWCPVKPGKSYQGPGGREVTVEILEN